MPCGEESIEEHSHSYVTSERQSRKAKEPRPFGLLSLKRLAALLVGHRPLRVCSLLARCQTLQENATQPMATFAMSSRSRTSWSYEERPHLRNHAHVKRERAIYDRVRQPPSCADCTCLFLQETKNAVNLWHFSAERNFTNGAGFLFTNWKRIRNSGFPFEFVRIRKQWDASWLGNWRT